MQTVLRDRSTPRRLGDLPQGRQVRTVLRSADGCAFMEVKVADRWRLENVGPVAAAAQPAR